MDAKSIRGLVWLTVVSLLCAIVAWTVDHAVFASTFVALGAVAILGAAFRHQRRHGQRLSHAQARVGLAPLRSLVR
jgi:hypothetical protein